MKLERRMQGVVLITLYGGWERNRLVGGKKVTQLMCYNDAIINDDDRK